MNCVLCGSTKDLDDRGKYLVCEKCTKEQLECEDRRKDGVVLDRDCSELCIRCGLCCVVLSAAVKPEEVERLAEWSGRLPTEIAMVEERKFEGEGKLVLKRPCIFLLGKPGDYVSCRAYQMDRPDVCGDYLCKLAIRYKAGICTLNEALFLLRASVKGCGNLGLFNWSSDPSSGRDSGDADLAALVAANRALRLLNTEDKEAENIRLALFERFHPQYEFSSSTHETIFAAIMTNFRNKALALNQFFSPEQIEEMSERDQEIALKVVYQVVEDISYFFVEKSRAENV